MAGYLKNHHHRIFCVVALAVWFALGWPFLRDLVSGRPLRDFPVSPLWLVPYALFGAAVLGAILLKLRATLQCALLGVQLAAVVAMAFILPSDLMSVFLIIIAWQVALATGPGGALSWVAVQTLLVVGTLALSRRPDLTYIVGISFGLQLFFVFIAQALRRETEAARALAQANRELRSAQAIIAHNVRDAERLRISRELHDAWGHELTALGLQLEIASHVTEPGRANEHVMQAKGLAGALLAKVRDVVARLRDNERSDRAETLEAAAQGFATPTLRADGGAGLQHGSNALVAGQIMNQHRWVFCVAALAVWLAVGWPVVRTLIAGGMIRGVPVSALWLVPFAVFGAAALAAMLLKLRPRLRVAFLLVQLAAVGAMAFIASWAMMSMFLVIVAWQVAMATGPLKALALAALQTLAIMGVLALAPNPDLCWVIGKSFALQLCFVFGAQALRREAETARALAETNEELQSAQALISNMARDAERLRISRELHDAWGHELTALGLQLEIATHTAPGRANQHVMQAKDLAGSLLGKVRDVVATLREAERCDLKEALEALAHGVPTPAVHVDIAPDVRVSPDQAHALMRCAQEAVTNAIKHAQASNLWLSVTFDGEGVRLVARDDGVTRPAASTPGSGLVGMRERVESLGGQLAVRPDDDVGFTVDAWLPSRASQAA